MEYNCSSEPLVIVIEISFKQEDDAEFLHPVVSLITHWVPFSTFSGNNPWWSPDWPAWHWRLLLWGWISLPCNDQSVLLMGMMMWLHVPSTTQLSHCWYLVMALYWSLEVKPVLLWDTLSWDLCLLDTQRFLGAPVRMLVCVCCIPWRFWLTVTKGKAYGWLV